MSKIEIFMFGFVDLVKSQRNVRVDLALEWQRDVAIVCKLLHSTALFFLETVPISTLYTRSRFEPAPSLNK